MGEPAILPFDWADPFDLNHQLTDEERMVRDTAGAYARDNLQPRVTEAYLNENFDREILREMGSLGLLGATIPEVYGGAGLGYVSSAGLRILLKAAKQAKGRGTWLALCALHPHVREVFDVSGFSNIFTIFGAREEAMADDSHPISRS